MLLALGIVFVVIGIIGWFYNYYKDYIAPRRFSFAVCLIGLLYLFLCGGL